MLLLFGPLQTVITLARGKLILAFLSPTSVALFVLLVPFDTTFALSLFYRILRYFNPLAWCETIPSKCLVALAAPALFLAIHTNLSELPETLIIRVKSLTSFPIMAIYTFIWGSTVVFFLYANFTALQLVLPLPLRHREIGLEDEEAA